jgi:serine/threonine-protein kinase
VVGPFEVLSDLGVGTMGRVARARQVSLNRLVALKILDSRLVRDTAQLDRFLREGRAAAALRHPNVAGLIDVGTCPISGKHYIAFELVDGPSVEDLLQERGRLEEQEALTICVGIAEAISCLEQHNLVHRDLQPSNILIADDGTPKIIDLGLAKRLDETGSVTVGAFISTPHYVAPEQAMALDQLDSRADLYGLGITLYRCVTGELPFDGDDFLSVVTQHVNEDIPDPRLVVPTLSPATASVIAGLCARNRDQRYTPRGALIDLHRALDGEAPLGPQEAAAAAAAGGMKPRSAPARVALDRPQEQDERSHLTDSKVAGASSADLLGGTPFKIVLTIDGKATEHTFDQPVVTIGRDPKCDLHINDKTVSRRHAELLRNGPTFALSVHQTANGTFLNERSVSELAIVTPSDEVRLAEKFRLRVLPVAHPSAAAPAGAPDPWRQAPGGFVEPRDRHEDTSEIERGAGAAASAEPVPGPEHDDALDDFDPYDADPARVEPPAPAPLAAPPKDVDEIASPFARPASAPPRPASTAPRAAPGLPPPLPRREVPSSDRLRRPELPPRPATAPARPAEPARPPSDRVPEVRPPTPAGPRPAPAEPARPATTTPRAFAPTEPSRRPPPGALPPIVEEPTDHAPPPRPRTPGVAAVLFSKNGEDQRVEITGSFKLGKGAECDLVLKHAHAPRKAALIVRGADGACTLFNVAPSPNTVTVNGKPVADEVVLQSGDQVAVYGTTLKFEG